MKIKDVITTVETRVWTDDLTLYHRYAYSDGSFKWYYDGMTLPKDAAELLEQEYQKWLAQKYFEKGCTHYDTRIS